MIYDRTLFLPVGFVSRAHGVRGEVHVRLYNAGSTAMGEVEAVYLAREGGEPRRYALRGMRPVEGGVLCALADVWDRNVAESLRGAEVLVSRADLPPLGEGELYVGDLEACEVVTREGRHYGTVRAVQALGAHDVLVIEDGDVERMLPFVEPFVVDVDLGARRITVDPPEGLPEERIRRRGRP